MKLFRLNIFAAFVVLALLVSCGKTNKQGKLIPKDAVMVLHLNGKSLNEKLPWDELKTNVLFAQLIADSSVPATFKRALENPDNSGIDIKTDILVFMLKDSAGAYVAVEGTVKDAAKFKSFNLDLSEGGSESETNGVSYIAKAPMCVGWNKEKFVYILNAPQLGNNISFGNTGSGGMTDITSSRDLGATCRSVFDLKESASLAKDEKFSDLMKKDGDIHFWLNAEQAQKGAQSIAALSMIKMDKIYEGSYTVATANFNEGKLDIDYKTYAGPAIKDVLKKYAGGNLDESMLKRLPAKDVAMALAFHFKPEGIKELLKVMELEPLINMGLAFVGFSLDDFIKANKGDIMLAISDFRMKTDSVSYKGKDDQDEYIVTSEPKPDFIFAAGVNDKDAFGKLIKAAQKMGSFSDSAVSEGKISYNTNNNLFAISNSKDNVDKYLAGGSNNFDFISKISGNPFGAYFNVQTLMKAYVNEATKDSSDRIIYDASLKFWDNIYMTGGDYSDGGISYKMEINLLDKKTNSLKQLNQYLAKVAEVMQAKRKAEELRWKSIEPVMMDTTAIIQAPVEDAIRK